mgnify:CR=1 FL=1
MGRKRKQGEEIRELIRHGLTPQEIIQHGYKRSTVYKVYKEFKEPKLQPLPLPRTWTITNLTFDKPEYQTEEEVTVSFGFKNISRYDIYLITIGVHPSWLVRPTNNNSSIYGEPLVYGKEVRDLIKPEEVKDFIFRFPIPDIMEREYLLFIYVTVTYLPDGIISNEGYPIGTVKIKNPRKPPAFPMPYE